ncbi:MAG: phosphoribosyltransferase family protein [Ignavibacteria bacterium]|nr:phosphoribosyltransferase family protein [Ignavibacteria bacterium]
MSERVYSLAVRLFAPVYELVYPPVCRGCSRRLPKTGRLLCGQCTSNLPAVSYDSGVYQTAWNRICGEEQCHSLIACFLFREEEVLQELIHRIKYNGDEKLAVELGRLIAPQVILHCREMKVDGVIPLPLHRSRRRERGFNQAERIASGVARSTGYRLMTPLRRRRYTPSQTRLSAAERTANVRDAFVVPRRRADQVRGKRFILVDDVLTTGATLREAAGSLTEKGALPPVACVVALAD